MFTMISFFVVAVHRPTTCRVAIKLIHRRLVSSSPDVLRRLRREIHLLSQLSHPHIIRLYQVVETPADMLFIMEYAPNEVFNLIADHGKLKEDEARRLFQQLASAVYYCHQHRIVHRSPSPPLSLLLILYSRDLKPENLLLDAQGQLKVADFGLANIMRDGAFLHTSCGSPNYAAPEVIQSRAYAGPEIDVWSCGVILYTMLCGRLPFDDDYVPALFRKIMQGRYVLPRHLSPQARDVLSRMLNVDPDTRITLPEILYVFCAFLCWVECKIDNILGWHRIFQSI